MFFNLKYHIASLVAVFLALGLGMLIGIAVPASDALDRQRQGLAASLEVQLAGLRQKNDYLQARVKSLEMDNNIRLRFEEEVVPVLVADRLAGRSIAVIVTSGSRMPNGLAGMFQASGAGIQSVTVLRGLAVGDRGSLLERLGWPEMDEKTFNSRVALEVSGAVLDGGRGVLDILAAEGVLSAEGNYGGPVDDVVIVGGSSEKRLAKADSIDLPLIDRLRARSVNVYGVEESRAAFSCIKEYQRKGITTVDNIDTAPGQVSLVYAISGQPGQYGIKSTARNLLPAMSREVVNSAR